MEEGKREGKLNAMTKNTLVRDTSAHAHTVNVSAPMNEEGTRAGEPGTKESHSET